MSDHASRICAKRQQAAEHKASHKTAKRSTPLWLLVCLVAAAAVLAPCLYSAGFASALRECPPTQHGERLLSSEQRDDGAVCRYAAGGAEYGRKIKTRKVMP